MRVFRIQQTLESLPAHQHMTPPPHCQSPSPWFMASKFQVQSSPPGCPVLQIERTHGNGIPERQFSHLPLSRAVEDDWGKKRPSLLLAVSSACLRAEYQNKATRAGIEICHAAAIRTQQRPDMNLMKVTHKEHTAGCTYIIHYI